MGKTIADLIGFVAAAIGGITFRDEIANASSFTLQRLGNTWNKVRLWYLHSVAARTWWLLMIVGAVLCAAIIGVESYASSIVRTDASFWRTILWSVSAIIGIPLVFSWIYLLPAFRIRDWFWVNDSTEELNRLARRLHDLRAARDDESVTDKPTEAEIVEAEQAFHERDAEYDAEYRRRHGYPRTPLYAVLVIVFGPIVTGVALALVAAYLGTAGGAEWYEAAPIAGVGFACYLIGEIMLRLFSAVLQSVLGDAGDALNRVANAALIRPGLLVLPFITEENYDKIMPKPVEVPFKQAAEAVKGATLSIRAILLTVIGWAFLLPEVSILGVVAFAGIATYVIITFHEYRKLDPKSFLEGSSKLHAWFMKSVMFYRIVQLVILALWRQWWSGDLIWNRIAAWCNNLLGDGGLNLTMVGLLIFGGTMAYFLSEKTKVMKHSFMINVFRAGTAFFALLAFLPLVGWALELGGAGDLRLPVMPAVRPPVSIATHVTEEPAATSGDASAPAHAPDAIERMTGTAETPTPIPPTEPVVPAAAEVTTRVASPRPSSERASATTTVYADQCERIAHTPGLTDLFRASMRRRFHCDG